MFIEIIIALLIGVFAGVITGIIPGIHVNLISLFVLSLLGYLSGFASPLALAVFITAMAVTQTFITIIPAVFLGAPDSESALSVLPGHKLMMKGLAYQAVKLHVIGSFFSLLVLVAISPLMLKIISPAYDFLSRWIGWILLAIVIWMFLREKGFKSKFWYVFVFMLSGILGLIVLNVPKLENGLFAMLTGLFGIPMLLLSISQKIKIPEQNTELQINVGKKNTVKSIFAGVLSGSIVSFFPGLGPSQGAIIGSEIVRNSEENSFLILMGGVNTVNMVMSFLTLYTIEKSRNGAIIAVSEIIKIDKNLLILFLVVSLVAGAIAMLLSLIISKSFSKIISRINYRLLCIGVIVFVTAIAFLLSGFFGLLILFVATSIGMTANLAGIKRSCAMGCLLLPVILWFIL